jgi:hypothetical protein
MKRRQFISHILAAFLQLAPLVRVTQSLPGVITSPAFIILRWIVGSAAVAGSFHGVSGATGIVPNVVRATNGVRTSLTFSITSSSRGTAKSYSVLSGLPPGLTLSTRGTLTGIPTLSGTFPMWVTGWQTSMLNGESSDLYVEVTVVSANPPVITNQPSRVSIPAGQTVNLTAGFKGDQPLILQWFKDDLEVDNATNAVLTITSAQTADSGRYRLRVANDLGTVFSDWSTLTVQAAAAKPVIVAQPVGQQLHAGEDFSLSVSATGNDLSYSWTRDGVVIGGSSPTLSVSEAIPLLAGLYRVRISNSGGFVDSDGVAVAVVGALRWGVPSLVSDSLRLPFNGIPGRRYAIEAASSPGSPFRLIGEVPGQADSSFDLESLTNSGRFYRIRPLP